uniref:ATP synthase YMF19-like N-terminal domain-containing protein n=1 Tax=viral metagenome TaxID=1070528 RepID=A0A6C0DQN6_9ZZZZ
MFSNSIYINIFSTIVFSLLIILLCQHLWNYMLDSFSNKKTKDLVNGQMEKYKKLMGIIKNKEDEAATYISKIEKQQMENDLENFVNGELDLLKNI